MTKIYPASLPHALLCISSIYNKRYPGYGDFDRTSVTKFEAEYRDTGHPNTTHAYIEDDDTVEVEDTDTGALVRDIVKAVQLADAKGEVFRDAEEILSALPQDDPSHVLTASLKYRVDFFIRINTTTNSQRPLPQPINPYNSQSQLTGFQKRYKYRVNGCQFQTEHGNKIEKHEISCKYFNPADFPFRCVDINCPKAWYQTEEQLKRHRWLHHPTASSGTHTRSHEDTRPHEDARPHEDTRPQKGSNLVLLRCPFPGCVEAVEARLRRTSLFKAHLTGIHHLDSSVAQWYINSQLLQSNITTTPTENLECPECDKVFTVSGRRASLIQHLTHKHKYENTVAKAKYPPRAHAIYKNKAVVPVPCPIADCKEEAGFETGFDGPEAMSELRAHLLVAHGWSDSQALLSYPDSPGVAGASDDNGPPRKKVARGRNKIYVCSEELPAEEHPAEEHPAEEHPASRPCNFR
ncbi:hypothetical protein PG984_001720 [Apiospora sp. TS-2023a]